MIEHGELVVGYIDINGVEHDTYEAALQYYSVDDPGVLSDQEENWLEAEFEVTMASDPFWPRMLRTVYEPTNQDQVPF